MVDNPNAHVILSPDRKTMTIRRAGGRQSTVHSALPNGFTAEQVLLARTRHTANGQPGQTNRTFRFRLGRRDFYTHINTGPPTWWRPRTTFSNKGTEQELSFGWLRVLIAVAIIADPDIANP